MKQKLLHMFQVTFTFFYYGEISKISAQKPWFWLDWLIMKKKLSDLSLQFFGFHNKKTSNIWNNFCFTHFNLSWFSFFTILLYKIQGFQENLVKCTKMPNPLQFFHWNHRSRYTYSLLNLFWHNWGCFFWGISKNLRGCVILVQTEQLTEAKICVAHTSTNLLGFLKR